MVEEVRNVDTPQKMIVCVDGVGCVHTIRHPLRGLLYLDLEQSLQWLAGITDALGTSLPPCNFVHHNSHIT